MVLSPTLLAWSTPAHTTPLLSLTVWNLEGTTSLLAKTARRRKREELPSPATKSMNLRRRSAPLSTWPRLRGPDWQSGCYSARARSRFGSRIEGLSVDGHRGSRGEAAALSLHPPISSSAPVSPLSLILCTICPVCVCHSDDLYLTLLFIFSFLIYEYVFISTWLSYTSTCTHCTF